MVEMANNTYLVKEAKAWVKRKSGPDEVVRILPHVEPNSTIICYELYSAFDESPDYLGRVLFDAQGYWIYDGDLFSVTEQEQIAKFIINYVETL
jgi:hypothetical protein